MIVFLRRRRPCPAGLPDVRCPARDPDIRLFGDGANLTADLPARRDSRVHVRVGSARLDGREHRGKVLRRQLLGGRRAGDDVGRRDRPRHGPLLRAMRRQPRRIRIGARLAQKDDDAAVHAQLADMDVRLRHGRLQPAIRLRVGDGVPVRGDRGGELPAGSRGHRRRLLVAGQQRADLISLGHSGYRQKAPHNRQPYSVSHLAPPFACPGEVRAPPRLTLHQWHSPLFATHDTTVVAVGKAPRRSPVCRVIPGRPESTTYWRLTLFAIPITWRSCSPLSSVRVGPMTAATRHSPCPDRRGSIRVASLTADEKEALIGTGRSRQLFPYSARSDTGKKLYTLLWLRAHTTFTQCTDRYPPDNGKSHVHKSTAHCPGGAQIILELTGVAPHVSLIRVDVALPVDHRLSVVALGGDRIDTSGERAWARAIREQRINRPFRDKPRAQGGNVWKLKSATGSRRDFVVVRDRVVFGGFEGQFGKQSAGAISELTDVLEEL